MGGLVIGGVSYLSGYRLWGVPPVHDPRPSDLFHIYKLPASHERRSLSF